eukprot:1618117-Rhodomonas_salina.2
MLSTDVAYRSRIKLEESEDDPSSQTISVSCCCGRFQSALQSASPPLMRQDGARSDGGARHQVEAPEELFPESVPQNEPRDSGRAKRGGRGRRYLVFPAVVLHCLAAVSGTDHSTAATRRTGFCTKAAGRTRRLGGISAGSHACATRRLELTLGCRAQTVVVKVAYLRKDSKGDVQVDPAARDANTHTHSALFRTDLASAAPRRERCFRHSGPRDTHDAVPRLPGGGECEGSDVWLEMYKTTREKTTGPEGSSDSDEDKGQASGKGGA